MDTWFASVPSYLLSSLCVRGCWITEMLLLLVTCCLHRMEKGGGYICLWYLHSAQRRSGQERMDQQPKRSQSEAAQKA